MRFADETHDLLRRFARCDRSDRTDVQSLGFDAVHPGATEGNQQRVLGTRNEQSSAEVGGSVTARGRQEVVEHEPGARGRRTETTELAQQREAAATGSFVTSSGQSGHAIMRERLRTLDQAELVAQLYEARRIHPSPRSNARLGRAPSVAGILRGCLGCGASDCSTTTVLASLRAHRSPLLTPAAIRPTLVHRQTAVDRNQSAVAASWSSFRTRGSSGCRASSATTRESARSNDIAATSASNLRASRRSNVF